MKDEHRSGEEGEREYYPKYGNNGGGGGGGRGYNQDNFMRKRDQYEVANHVK